MCVASTITFPANHVSDMLRRLRGLLLGCAPSRYSAALLNPSTAAYPTLFVGFVTDSISSQLTTGGVLIAVGVLVMFGTPFLIAKKVCATPAGRVRSIAPIVARLPWRRL